jgi:D-alanyl-D-alanine carboxypeptidase
MVRLAALGLGGLAVACGRGGSNSHQANVFESPAPTTSAAPTSAGERSATTPAPGVKAEPVCLVTKERGLSASYVPPDLALLPARVSAGDGVKLRQAAADAAVSLIDAAAADGQVLFALSGFRTYQEQEDVLANEIKTFGKQVAERQVAPPGHSEHQLGLALDVTSRRAPFELREQMGDEPEGRWLATNAPKFGFVISYPKGKESVTGYTYEPWHIRYVGKQIAEQVAASGLTLTEFLPKNNLAGACP